MASSNLAPIPVSAPVPMAINEVVFSSSVWKPTLEQFQSFRSRDRELARMNLLLVLSFARRPMTWEDIKTSTLHNFDIVQQVLLRQVEVETVQQHQDGFLLTPLGKESVERMLRFRQRTAHFREETVNQTSNQSSGRK